MSLPLVWPKGWCRHEIYMQCQIQEGRGHVAWELWASFSDINSNKGHEKTGSRSPGKKWCWCIGFWGLGWGRSASGPVSSSRAEVCTLRVEVEISSIVFVQAACWLLVEERFLCLCKTVLVMTWWGKVSVRLNLVSVHKRGFVRVPGIKTSHWRCLSRLTFSWTLEHTCSLLPPYSAGHWYPSVSALTYSSGGCTGKPSWIRTLER